MVSPPASNQQAQPQEFFSQVGPVRQCFVVTELHNKSRNRGYGYVHFVLPEDATSALEELKGKQLLGNAIHVELARKRDASDQRNMKKRERSDHSVSIFPEAKKPKITANTTARLIVRNLSFKCTPEKLSKAFSKYGTVKEATMPRKSAGGEFRGFGIVQFARRTDASKAMEVLNGTEICGRIVAVDWCLPQAQYLVAEGVPVHQVKEQIDQKFSGKAQSSASKNQLPVTEPDRQSDEESMADEEDEPDLASNAEHDGSSDAEEQDPTVKDVTQQDSDSDEEPESARLPGASEGRTLFVRNVPFDCSEDELSNCFSQFGKLVYVKITRDAETNRSKGTAFVCFDKKASAEDCLKEAQQTNNVAFSMARTSSETSLGTSLLQPELPNVLMESPLVLSGRMLNVVKAVERGQAAVLTAKEKAKRDKGDKRNLYLTKEGSQNEESNRRSTLDKNPAFYVSRTRVALRKLPSSISDKLLKQLATSAAHKYLNTVVSKGSDPTFPKTEVQEAGESEEDWGQICKSIKIGVYQAKVIKSKDRVDSNGKPKSKGFGFVEFSSHRAAMACVRALADVHGSPAQDAFTSVIDSLQDADNEQLSLQALQNVQVEFAIENKQVVSMREAKLRRNKAQKNSKGSKSHSK